MHFFFSYLHFYCEKCEKTYCLNDIPVSTITYLKVSLGAVLFLIVIRGAIRIIKLCR